MLNKISVLALLALLAACSDGGSNPFDDEPEPTEDTGGDTGGETEEPVEEGEPFVGVTSGALSAANYDDGAGTLSLTINLDGDDTLQAYTADGDFLGYARFVQQDDPNDRYYTAFAQTSADGSVTAVLTMDGGQFNRYYGGTSLEADGLSLPESGLVSYAGSYVGLLNLDRTDVPVPAASDPEIQAGASQQVGGSIFLNVEFGENLVNGKIYDRQRFAVQPTGDDDATGTAMDDVVLILTNIEADGSFAGTAENDALEAIGFYEGRFGGTDAANLAGGVYLNGDFITTVEGENEYGIFVLGQCPGGGGGAAECGTAEGLGE